MRLGTSEEGVYLFYLYVIMYLFIIGDKFCQQNEQGQILVTDYFFENITRVTNY